MGSLELKEMNWILGQIEENARLALIEEVFTTPKPGLVDLNDNGAHTDMDWKLFVKSAETISPYFKKIGQTAYEWDQELTELFPVIRELGQKAEKAMFQTTNGVNTHKGAIFTFSILAAGIGCCMREEEEFSSERIFLFAQQITKSWMEKDFIEMKRHEPKTAGEIIYARMNLEGIRGEAGRGFPIIMNNSYPRMKYYMQSKMEQNERNLNVLLSILTELTDTNILARSEYNLSALTNAQHLAKVILSLGGAGTEKGMECIKKWNQQWIEDHISPGGAADILAATIFICRMEQAAEMLVTR